MDQQQILGGRYATNSSDVITDTVDGEAVAIRLDSGAYYSFSDGGTVCWNLIRAGVRPADLNTAVGSPAVLAEFVDSLLTEGLLRPAPQAGPSPAVDPTLDLRDVDLRFQRHEEMVDLFAMDPIHEVDPDSGWPVADAEPHRDSGLA